MRVLLIEDDWAVRQSLEMVLRDDAMCVDGADCGEEGIQTARRYDYDVIVLDLSLPDMSGLEVVRSLRRAKLKTPVIILSGSAVAEDKINALQCGADDYMTKPVSCDDLTARMRTVMLAA